MAEAQGHLDTISKSVQLVSIIAGVVFSILSFNAARQQEAQARAKEADAKVFELQKYYDQQRDEDRKRQIEAAKPFLELRQQRYKEAVRAASILSNPEDNTSDEVAKARKRFRQLYVAELSMVEGWGVETAMMELARAVDPTLLTFTPAQSAAYNLAHALRDSLINSWQVNEAVVDNPNR